MPLTTLVKLGCVYEAPYGAAASPAPGVHVPLPLSLILLASFRVMNERNTVANDNSEELEALDMWDEVEANFATVSAQAWNSMVLQIFKVFVLGRVTLKSLRAMPGEVEEGREQICPRCERAG